MKKALAFLAGALACYAADAPSSEPAPVSVSFETSVVSSYLWRGFVVNDSPSLQPALTVGFKGFTASAWSNLSKSVPHHQAWTETDFTLEYAREVGKFELSAGFLDYRFPDLDKLECNRTAEFSLGVSYKTFLSPSLKYYHDVRNVHGSYYFAGGEHTFVMNRERKVFLNMAGGVGLNHRLYQSITTVSDVDLTTTLSVPVGKVVLNPFVTVMRGHRSLFGTHTAFGLKFTMGS